MAEEKKNEASTPEESNIDHINSFVTSSEQADQKVDYQAPVYVKEETKDKEVVVEKEEVKEPEKKPAMHNNHVKKEDKKVNENHAKDHERKDTKNGKAEKKSDPVKKPQVRAVRNEPQKKRPTIIVRPIKEGKMAKHHKEHKERKPKVSKNTLMWIGIGFMALVLIIALVMIIKPAKTPGAGNETTNSIAATVNGDPIYLNDVMSEYNKLNPVLQQVYTPETILNKSIDDLLLYQEAKNRDIIVKPEEVKAEITNVKIENKLTDTAFENALKQQGLTVADAEKIIEKNLAIRKLLNETVLKDIKVSESAIEKYYQQNLDQYKVADQVTVQHILVMITDNRTDAQAKAIIDQVNKELNATNFCDLVQKYSEDPGSLSTCGAYTFAKGDFNNPEFENPSFELRINETTIVKTTFGYHLIKKLASIPAHTQAFSEVRSDINETLHNEIAQDNFNRLLLELRANATIVNYMTKTDSNSTSTQVNLDTFAQCITEKGATFYGAYWCPHCNNQKEMFGESLKYVNYVECAVEGQPQVQTKACTDAGISGYPTWVINGKSYPGEQTIASLAKLTGCKAP